MISAGQTWEEIRRIRSCCVFLFLDVVCVVAAPRTAPGSEIDCEPVFEINRGAVPSCLGDAVVAALKSYRLDVTPPDFRRETVSPLLKRTGLTSWRQLEKKAVAC
jgi:hypothetical protein